MDKQQIQNLIKELIEKTTVKTTGIYIEEDNPKNTWFRVEVSEPNFFVERNGEALYALNHLVRKMIETKTLGASEANGNLENSRGILIDINNFQKRRVENIRAVAHMMSERARYFKANIEVDPMSAFERRIVHEFLADALDLKTESVGFGSTRRVVIKYTGN
ncbi:hypothetical protein A2814_01505 [Candidatus Nomurabacteria bacterium RIFCSPHIGHO2_01_FULL_38_19]|uniref:R3H domain-containing protein n=1 Tax=Candidatus Nomurabacteria bacterium RIFCSPHIGHO2_01_FULL_38_19 TaxID=1801732 RepID=A0A1F6URM9_9BACT|nr:MAG: hypothetical protein A2814_01505 [Candidatus Nomurabacteria bacterium RIFCSPHIGHO2_01_FULL_38_19]